MKGEAAAVNLGVVYGSTDGSSVASCGAHPRPCADVATAGWASPHGSVAATDLRHLARANSVGACLS